MKSAIDPSSPTPEISSHDETPAAKSDTLLVRGKPGTSEFFPNLLPLSPINLLAASVG
jgi:hypothetical protein